MGHALFSKDYLPPDVPQYVAYDIPGASFLIVGWIAAWRRPHSRIGLLMMAVGLLWFVGQAGWIPTALATSLSNALNNAWEPVLAHVFVSFPSGRLRTRRDRQVMTLTYAWYVLSTLANTRGVRPRSAPDRWRGAGDDTCLARAAPAWPGSSTVGQGVLRR